MTVEVMSSPALCDQEKSPRHKIKLKNSLFWFSRILLRVRLLFFLRHEVIGVLGPKIKEGCSARFVSFSQVLFIWSNLQ